MNGKSFGSVLIILLGAFISLTTSLSAQSYCSPSTACNTRYEWIRSGSTNITLPAYCYKFGVDNRTGIDTIYMKPGEATEVRAKNLKFADVTCLVYVDWNNDKTFAASESYEMLGVYLDANGHSVNITPPAGITSGTYRMRFQIMRTTEYQLNGPNACLNGAYVYIDVSLNVTNTPPTGGGGYCPSAPTNWNCGYYYIRSVDIQGDGTGIYRSSFCDKYFDGSNLEARWTTGNAYLITTVNYRPTTLNVQTYVFIDWNEDMDFADPDEVYTSPVNYQTQDFAIVVPTDVSSGKKRVRIVATLGPATPIPCGSYASGETEDYTVEVINAQNPPPNCVSRSTYIPTNFAKGICTDLDTVSWDAVPNADEYFFTMRAFGSGSNAMELTVNTNYVVIPAGTLQPSKTYEVSALAKNAYGEAQNCQKSRFTTTGEFGDIAISPSESFTMCLGEVQALDATITPPKTGDMHAWSGPSGFLSATNIKDPDLTALEVGEHNFTFTLTNADGCNKEVPVTVEVFNSPEGTDIKDTLGELCLGEKFVTTVLPGNAEVLARSVFTVERFDPNTSSFVSTSDRVVGDQLTITQNQLGKHVYRLKVNLNSCIVYTREMDIEVFAIPDLPNITPSGNLSFCRGDVTELKVTNFTSGLEWNTGRVGPSLSLEKSGAYNVTYTSPQGCVSKSLDVNVNIKEPPIKPTIKIVGNGVYCAGDVVPLTASVDADYFWSNGSSGDTIYVDKSGTYGLTVTSPNGCQNAATQVVLEFKELPPAPIIFEIANRPLCEGDKVKLINQGLEPVQWSTGATGDEITIDQDGSYFAFTQNGSCINFSQNYDYEFGEIPQEPEIAFTPEGPYCQGQEVKAFIKNGLRVTWSTSETKDTITVNQAKTLTAVHRAVNGCEASSLPEDVAFVKLPSKPSIISSWDSLRVQDDLFPKYAWYKQGNRLENEDKYFIIPDETATFTVMALSAEGCESPMSDPSFTVVGIEEKDAIELSYYPNPFNGTFTIKANSSIDDITLLTVDGKTIAFDLERVSEFEYRLTTKHKGYLILQTTIDDNQLIKPILSQ